jgi:orotidine-5'-phosphate decarboxylase
MSPANLRERLIVALDVPDVESAMAAAKKLDRSVGMLKIGLELFVAQGPDVVRAIRDRFPEYAIFLDLKLHDIPNTMRGAIRAAKHLGVRFLTVHSGSGTEHLRACVDEAGDSLGILAVTVLTSQDETACREAGHTRLPVELVEMRAVCAREAGCAGVVCSGQELARVRSVAPELFRVVPGIRPLGNEVGDQKRVMTPEQAMAEGATHLVVGRPIMGAADPRAAALAILEDMGRSLRKS